MTTGPGLDIGSGHRLLAYTQHGRPVGYHHEHRHRVTGALCRSTVLLERAPGKASGVRRYRVVAEQPLTLEPEVVCIVCGDRGRVEGARWKPG